MKKIFLLLALVTFNASADYSAPKLLARSSTLDGYNLPPMTFMNNTGPVINDRGDVAFRVLNIEGSNNQGIWGKLSTDTVGKIYIVAPDERFITEPALNNHGDIVYSLFDEGITDGIFVFNLESLEDDQVLDPSKYGLINYTYPIILDNKTIYFRGTNEKNDRTLFKYSDKTLVPVFTEGQGVVGPQNKKINSSYIFRPVVNQKGQIGLKMRFGKRHDWGEELVDGIIALGSGSAVEDKPKFRTMDLDGDELSQFKAISNVVSINNKNEMTFIGFLDEGKKAVYKSSETELVRVALEGEKGISEIEYFSPRIIDNGSVFFRAKDHEGKRSIYKVEGDTVWRLIGEGDEIVTDLGPAKILWNKFFPGLSGEIDVNNKGDVVLHALLVKDDNREIGDGIVLLENNK